MADSSHTPLHDRYLGDLSGCGQVIGQLMQRHFGFDTNGVGFYLFEQIAKPKEFKETVPRAARRGGLG